MRNNASRNATVTATMHCPHFDRTVVFGSVIMKKTNSWYIGPVIGANSDCTGVPMMKLRNRAKTRNDATYVAVICKR